MIKKAHELHFISQIKKPLKVMLSGAFSFSEAKIIRSIRQDETNFFARNTTTSFDNHNNLTNKNLI
jgi:hypothetical protein